MSRRRLTAMEAAIYVGCHLNEIYRMRKRGVITAYTDRAQRGLLFDPSELDQVKAAREIIIRGHELLRGRR